MSKLMKVVFYKELSIGSVDLKKEMYYKLYDMSYYSSDEVKKEVNSVVSVDEDVDYYDCFDISVDYL